MTVNRFFVRGELNDERIVAALKRSARDYDNGDIAEVRDLLLEIVAAIDAWEEYYHGK